MRTVAIRELKNKLSAYLREVRSGEILLVTDRGRVVAEIRPPVPQQAFPAGASPGYVAMLRLVEMGKVRPGYPVRDVKEVYRASRVRAPRGTARKVLSELRKDRWEE